MGRFIMTEAGGRALNLPRVANGAKIFPLRRLKRLHNRRLNKNWLHTGMRINGEDGTGSTEHEKNLSETTSVCTNSTFKIETEASTVRIIEQGQEEKVFEVPVTEIAKATVEVPDPVTNQYIGSRFIPINTLSPEAAATAIENCLGNAATDSKVPDAQEAGEPDTVALVESIVTEPLDETASPTMYLTTDGKWQPLGKFSFKGLWNGIKKTVCKVAGVVKKVAAGGIKTVVDKVHAAGGLGKFLGGLANKALGNIPFVGPIIEKATNGVLGVIDRKTTGSKNAVAGLINNAVKMVSINGWMHAGVAADLVSQGFAIPSKYKIYGDPTEDRTDVEETWEKVTEGFAEYPGIVGTGDESNVASTSVTESNVILKAENWFNHATEAKKCVLSIVLKGDTTTNWETWAVNWDGSAEGDYVVSKGTYDAGNDQTTYNSSVFKAGITKAYGALMPTNSGLNPATALGTEIAKITPHFISPNAGTLYTMNTGVGEQRIAEKNTKSYRNPNILAEMRQRGFTK